MEGCMNVHDEPCLEGNIAFIEDLIQDDSVNWDMAVEHDLKLGLHDIIHKKLGYHKVLSC